jgi:hypothetical protein
VFTLPFWATPAVILVVILAGLWLSERSSANGASASTSASVTTNVSAVSADSYELERQQRALRVCGETAQRITRGATVGEADVEGWVVEFSAVSPTSPDAPASAPDLAAFLRFLDGKARARFIWSEAPELAKLDGPTTFVEVRHAPSPALTRTTLTFFGRYVSPYFIEEQRPTFMRLAAALADQLGATHAGLYARCERGASHHLGTWFRGETPAAAVAALLVWMGAHAVVPFLDEASLGGDAGNVDSAVAFPPVAERARRLDRAGVAHIIGEHGGMIAGKPAGVTTLSFSFRDGNRATRASLDLARALGVARVSAQ